MRHSEVQSLFLRNFGKLYPRLTFRGLRHLASAEWGRFRFVLRVALGRHGGEVDLLCRMLSDGYPQEVVAALQDMRSRPQLAEEKGAIPVVVAPYLGDDARALCQDAGIGYFDLAGNAGLDTATIFLEISGKANPDPRRKEVQALYEGKAERILRALLLEPQRQWKMRELASRAEVSLGLASMVTTALSNEGLVDKGRKGLSLLVPNLLLDKWADEYDVRRSNYYIFRSFTPVAELEERLLGLGMAFAENVALTLWSGAHHLLATSAEQLRLSLYWTGDLQALVRALRLHEVRGTNSVFVFRPYDASLLWEVAFSERRLPIVNPLQLYLDLACGDDEERALAQRVRERFLTW